jgi:putative Holliday junction resolvase
MIGIDYGMARVGLAYSDESMTIAFPLETVKADKKSTKTVVQVVGAIEKHRKLMRYEIEAIVVGLPLMMSGKAGLMVDEVKHFIQLINEALPGVRIVEWDERLSSVMADRAMREGSMTRKRRAQHVDTVAATIILQSYLDSLKLRSLGAGPPDFE